MYAFLRNDPERDLKIELSRIMIHVKGAAKIILEKDK